MQNNNSSPIKRQICKIKPKLFSAQKIIHSLPITMHTALPCYELCYVIKGNGKIITENEMYEFNNSDLILVNKNIQRGLFFEGDGEIISLAVTFKSEIQISLSEVSIFPSDKYSNTFESLFSITLNESKNRNYISKYLNENLLRSILICLIRLSMPNDAYSAKNKTFMTAKKYFDEHFLTLENIDSVCNELKINKFFLTHLFKENLGEPPIKYLIEKRMTFAKKLLDETNKSIGEVAKDCGYVDVAYFCRIFKKFEGITPLKYRRSEK